MREENLKLYTTSSGIVLKKENSTILIRQAVDNDILFSTESEAASIEFSFTSENIVEWQVEQIFESLMKSIIGRYILKGHQNLPYLFKEDFIDLDKRRILWHSDSRIDNTLLLQYEENKIVLFLIKDEQARNRERNVVRVCSSGSSYEYYYQEFREFYKKLEAYSQIHSKDTLHGVEEDAKKKSINDKKCKIKKKML